MLSIVIASNRNENFQTVQQNIAETAGVDYELLRLHVGDEGLSRYYNQGAAAAAFPYLCFVHDDVLFHTQAWGPKIIALLRQKQTGVVGVMGSRYKSYFGAGWRDGPTDFFRMHVKDGAEGGRLLVQNPGTKNRDEVVCLDGVFLCCTKAHWQRHPFDEKTFAGFHFYDLDFCLQAHLAGLKNTVTFEVLLEHFSQGKRDGRFLQEFLRFQEKWKAVLPRSLETLSQTSVVNFEGYALAETLWLMKKNRFAAKERRKQLRAYRSRCKKIYHLLRSFYFGFLK